jgi:hypothetical protein
VKATVDKEAMDKRATVMEAVDKEVVIKRSATEAATEEVAVGAIGDSPAPGQAPPFAAGAKRLHPAGQTTIHVCLEASVCPMFLYSAFFTS